MLTRREFIVSNGLVLAVSAAHGKAGQVDLPFRQVHLDFHTGGQIPDVAADFAPGNLSPPFSVPT